MSTRWRIIDLTDYSGEIKPRHGHLDIDGHSIPLADVACLLTGPSTQWSGHLMASCARHDIIILACDWRSVPISATYPWSENTRIAARHHAQADLSLPRRKNAWMRIVRAKISGQAANLPATSASQQRLTALAATVRSGDPANVEATAAKAYWSGLFPHERFTRDRHLPGRNGHLNYGYAIVRGVVLRSVWAAGLSPTLGIWHHQRSNPFGLVDDLLEPFRPAVDHHVCALSPDASLDDRAVKEHLVSVLDEPMSSNGMTVRSSTVDLAQNFARYVEGVMPHLIVPTWTPVDG